MLIQKIKINNYKTYLSLDLDLTVNEERPIILIGGSNGGGKTTLFEAISGALYGLKIENKEQFTELLNQGALQTVKPEIVLQITFVGKVLGQEQKYILRRTYVLNPTGKPLESVMLNMNGNTFTYGTATPAKERRQREQEVNKIIKANLPQELSKYFLFDAMQSSKLLEKNVFAQTIQDNFENVLGFKKYLQLKRATATVLQERTQQRLAVDEEIKEYNELCDTKKALEDELAQNTAAQDRHCKYMVEMEENYRQAKAGVETAVNLNKKIQELTTKIDATTKRASSYTEKLKQFVDNIDVNVCLPQLATRVDSEVNNMLHIKDKLKKENSGAYPVEMLKDITEKIVDYLKSLSLCNNDVDEQNVVNHIIALQQATNMQDPFDYLDEEEVEALRGLLRRGGSNIYPQLESEKQEVEHGAERLKQQKIERHDLEQTIRGGDETLIARYEESQYETERLKSDEEKIRGKIAQLNKHIHQYDCQTQQEPDLQYDTLLKMTPLFDTITARLLKKKKAQIENEMKQQLNLLLLSYKDHIARVELSESLEHFSIKLYHTAGNEIYLNQLNAASKQIFIQVLLKVLRNLGDYNPPVMIDTVMGVLDNESRDALMEEYFPQLAEQTILLCTTSEVRTDSDYLKLEPFISKTYTLNRNVETQSTSVEEGYFGITLNQ